MLNICVPRKRDDLNHQRVRTTRSTSSRLRFAFVSAGISARHHRFRLLFSRHFRTSPGGSASFLFPAAFSPTFAHWCFTYFFAAATPALSAATGRLVHGRPGTCLSCSATSAAFLVTLRNMLSLSFLFRCVFLFASPCHEYSPNFPVARTSHDPK